MRICLDIQSAVSQRAGVGRYTRKLAEHLGALARDDVFRLFYFDFQKKGEPFEAPGAERQAVRWCPGRLAQLAWKTVGWPPFNWFAGEADLYHFPNFILPPLCKGKTVVTIHDMSFLRYPQFAEPKNQRYLSARIRNTVQRADAILTDSRFSAGEIETLLSVDASRIHAVHLGIDPSFHRPQQDRIRATLARLGIDRPYLLSVGTIEPRKNLPFLVDVYERLADFDGLLVLAGMPGWKCDPIFERLRDSSRSDSIRYLRYVPDQDLPGLYAGAEAFLVSSHYEGFGFPPLEAMACGTPVLSSTGGSLPEVLGSAARLLPDFDVEQWTAEICNVLQNSDLRESMINAGLQQARSYDWETTARQTWDVYRALGAAQ